MAGVDHIFVAQLGVAAFDLGHHVVGLDFAHFVLCVDGDRGFQRHGLEIARKCGGPERGQILRRKRRTARWPCRCSARRWRRCAAVEEASRTIIGFANDEAVGPGVGAAARGSARSRVRRHVRTRAPRPAHRGRPPAALQGDHGRGAAREGDIGLRTGASVKGELRSPGTFWGRAWWDRQGSGMGGSPARMTTALPFTSMPL